MVKDYLEKRKANLEQEKAERSKELDDLTARVEALEKINEESNDESELKAAGEELDELNAKKAELEADIKAKQDELDEVNAQIDELDKPTEPQENNQRNKLNFMKREERNTMTLEQRQAQAQKFIETRRTQIDNTELRAVLVSSGKVLTPTGTDGINDNGFAKVSSILDLVKVENCQGMGSNKIAYQVDDAVAALQTEGGAAVSSNPTFDFVTITPQSVAVLGAISKQAKKQTPLQYEAKVKDSAMVGLRKQAAKIVTDAVVASTLTTPLTGVKAIDAQTLRTIAFNYGGSEGVDGEAWLFLNKADLIKFGDARGSNEKKAVYEITPSAGNPNTGTIKDGGLVVNYCINSNLPAGTMIYGNPRNIELDIFSNYEIAVSEDFYFDKLMDAIRGDVELGADVVAKDGLLKVTITA